MSGRGGDAPPPPNSGEYLLQLLRRPPNPPTPSTTQPPSQNFSMDPAVAAVGPTIPTFPLPHATLPSNGRDLGYNPWNNGAPPPFAPHNYFQQNPNLNPDFRSRTEGFNYSHQHNLQSGRVPVGDDMRKLGSYGDTSKQRAAHQQEQNLIFGSLNRDAGDVLRQSLFPKVRVENHYTEPGLRMDRSLNRFPTNNIEVNGSVGVNSSVLRNREQESISNSSNTRKQGGNGSDRLVAPPPGFSSNVKNLRNREPEYRRRTSGRNVDKAKGNSGNLYKNDNNLSDQIDFPGPSAGSKLQSVSAPDRNVDKGKGNSGNLYKDDNNLSDQIDFPGPSAGSKLQSVSSFDIEESMMKSHGEGDVNGDELRNGGQDKMNRDYGRTELDDLEDQLVGSLGLEDESSEKSEKKKHRRDKDYRADKRGQWIMGQRMRNVRRQTPCRNDINRLNDPFLAVFKSLIPADEEKDKQKQLLTLLKRLVVKEWPEARLYLYGSCANSFGFPKSDIDVCLAMELGNSEKSEILLKLADILQSDNLQNVQALVRARVPIVKLMDPVTGISCDICVNNVLAVVNTKLLHDYAQIDGRLRQLAFIVKHWAKSRGVNETYHGTLSSYAYVLMCIHFLQRRRPAILPCLQGMETTYFVNVDNVECAYFDKVDKLRNFGSRNEEGIAQLVWAFFQYWAYCHDYANDVISIRTGSTLSKRAKDWTRRVGNDRHLICIEDPFEISHDLGRVVDKYSIRVLREEFERAAEIMQFDPNPCVTLFEPYIRDNN